MPIVIVELVIRPDEQPSPTLAAECADRAAAVFRTEAGRTWVRLHLLPSEQYAEDGGGPMRGVYPVFVHVLHARRPVSDELAQEVSALTTAMAEACGRPAENVHIFYEADGAGRVAFGGRLVD